jgi:GT2 family glycosyltransferase
MPSSDHALLTPGQPQQDQQHAASSPGELPGIVAVAVLYRRSIRESESVSSLLRILSDHPEWQSAFSLLLYDNSPEPQTVPPDLPLTPMYLHDPSNGGLAPAYNYALGRALASGAPWLLLLDQDTTLTVDYLTEALARIRELHGDPRIGAIAPKLTAAGNIYSPESDFLYRMRMQFRSIAHPVALTDVGVQARPMSAYNSGTLVRVSALEAAGGFPTDFWLDYLDHATFQELDRRGYRIFVMQSTLHQKLSHSDINDVPHWRHHSVLTAQTRFLHRYGNWRERIFFRIYLLRTCFFLFINCKDRRVWKEMFLQAFVLRIPSVRLGRE